MIDSCFFWLSENCLCLFFFLFLFSPLLLLGVTALTVLKTGELLIGTGDGVVCRANQIELIVKDPVKKLEESSMNKKSKPKTEMRLKEAEYVYNLLFVVFA